MPKLWSAVMPSWALTLATTDAVFDVLRSITMNWPVGSGAPAGTASVEVRFGAGSTAGSGAAGTSGVVGASGLAVGVGLGVGSGVGAGSIRGAGVASIVGLADGSAAVVGATTGKRDEHGKEQWGESAVHALQCAR